MIVALTIGTAVAAAITVFVDAIVADSVLVNPRPFKVISFPL